MIDVTRSVVDVVVKHGQADCYLFCGLLRIPTQTLPLPNSTFAYCVVRRLIRLRILAAYLRVPATKRTDSTLNNVI
jgi:hypothetical protein